METHTRASLGKFGGTFLGWREIHGVGFGTCFDISIEVLLAFQVCFGLSSHVPNARGSLVRKAMKIVGDQFPGVGWCTSFVKLIEVL